MAARRSRKAPRRIGSPAGDAQGGRSPSWGAPLQRACQRGWLARHVRGVGGTRPPRLFPGGGNGKGGVQAPCCRRRIVASCCARGNRFGTPTTRAALENVAMVEKPVEHRTDSSGIAQQFPPVFYWTIGSQ